MADISTSKLRQFFTKIRRAFGLPVREPVTSHPEQPSICEPISVRPEDTAIDLKPQTPTIVPPEDSSKEANPEISRTYNSFPNKITGLSLTPMGTGWRTWLRGGEIRVFDALAVLEIAKRGDANVIRIDLLGGGRHEKLGYLTPGVATTLRMACAKVNPDSEMGRAIAQQSIPCRAQVYRGDLRAPNETDRYSYAHTDVVRRVKDTVKTEKKLKR